jgi:hypothetical protein
VPSGCDSQVETALQPIVLVSAVQVPVALQQECRQTVGRVLYVLRVGLVPLMLTKHGIGTGGQIRECQREESRGVPMIGRFHHAHSVFDLHKSVRFVAACSIQTRLFLRFLTISQRALPES